MADWRIFSGNTEVIDKRRKKWYESLDGKRLEWEELAAAKSTNEVLKKVKPVPLYQYIVNYLLYVWEGRKEKIIRYEQAIGELTEHVSESFKRNGMPEKNCEKSHIKEILTTEWSREWDSFEKAASDRIFELALGLCLPADDVEQLLQKAVKRAGFNYYAPEELLVYCALRFQMKDCFRCYQALCRDYNAVIPFHSKKSEPDFESTVEIKNRMIKALEKNMSAGCLYSTTAYEPGTLNPELKKFFALHKAKIPSKRTAAVVFEKLYNRFIKVHEKELLDFKISERGNEEYAQTVLKVEYDADCDIFLPAGSVFYSLKGKEKKQIRFKLEQEKKLPQKEMIEIVIPAVGTEKYVVCTAKKTTPGYIRKGEELLPEKKALENGVVSANTMGTFKYSGKPGSMGKARGIICALCIPGTKLPAGTKFFFNQYTYETEQECTALASAEITVRSEIPCVNGEKLAGTGEVKYMESPPKGIISVSNAKPVHMKMPTNRISKELFRDYLYLGNASCMDTPEKKIDRTLLGKWFTETEIKSSRFSDIQRQAGSGAQYSRKEMVRSEVRRCDIITLAFLNFCTDVEAESEEYIMEAEPEAVYQDFLLYVNPLLKECAMMPFYLQNPYEYMLAYLMQTDTPLDSLRNMWKIVNLGKEGANEQKKGQNTSK